MNRNNVAAQILNDLIEKGVVEQDEQGQVIVRKGPNVIGNKADVDMVREEQPLQFGS